jgi:hypothetical protein
MSMNEIEKIKIIIKRMKTKFDIKIKCQWMKLKKKYFNKRFRTEYIAIKSMGIKSDIKIKCQRIKLKKKLNIWFKTKYIAIKRMKI